jgi:hypothetical protein
MGWSNGVFVLCKLQESGFTGAVLSLMEHDAISNWTWADSILFHHCYADGARATSIENIALLRQMPASSSLQQFLNSVPRSADTTVTLELSIRGTTITP